MPWPVEDARDYLRLVARILWQPRIQRQLDLSDVVQQTLLKAHEKKHQFRGDTEEEWRGWLRRILKNVLLQAEIDNPPGEGSVNESSSLLDKVVAADHTSPSERIMRHEQMERLAAALGQLLEGERTAVELKHLHGCSVEFISQYMGRTKNAVAGVLKRGMRKLRDLLKEEREGEKG